MASRTSRAFVSTKFRAWRLRRGLGHEELARRLHYHRSTISAIENGHRRPTPRFLELLQRVFDVTPETFYALALAALLAVVVCCEVCGDVHLPGVNHGDDVSEVVAVEEAVR